MSTLEPFGSGNPAPILCSRSVVVLYVRRMGADGQHVKLTVDDRQTKLEMLAFNAPEHFFAEIGSSVHVWYQPDINEWQGRRSVEGRLLHVELA